MELEPIARPYVFTFAGFYVPTHGAGTFRASWPNSRTSQPLRTSLPCLIYRFRQPCGPCAMSLGKVSREGVLTHNKDNAFI